MKTARGFMAKGYEANRFAAKKVLAPKRFLAAALLFTLLFNTVPVSALDNAAPPNTQAAVAEKDEVVYARLSGKGEAQNVYVVNHFTLSQTGRFTDYGDYSKAVNLTDLQPVTLGGGEVSVQTASDNFYYQGYLNNTNLPWVYNISYKIDGTEYSAEEIAGKTGKLEIKLTSEKNGAADDIFYNNYMQQISVSLNTEKCKNITADGATLAGAGKNRMLAFTVLPKTDAAITVTADVTDFEMAGIDITVMPFSMNIEMPNTSDMLGEFDKLTDAVSELNDGVIELNNGAKEIENGAAQLKTGSEEFNGGINQLNANSSRLTASSAQIRDALAQISQASAMLAPLAQADPQMGAVITGLTEGLAELSGNYSAFHGGLTSYTGGVSELASGYGEINSGVAELADGIAGFGAGITALADGTGQLAEETKGIPEQIETEIDGLMSDYTGGEFEMTSFTSPQNKNIKFVQFVFKTAGIEKPEINTSNEDEQVRLSFWDRLKNLFT
jgi:X-X-X-Leu-X-X-Gly heptad repeat protein